MGLKPASLPVEARTSATPRHLLALSGGGFRGLFTATVLAAFEAEAKTPLASRFDMIAGTSIGGILAIGLAAGVSAQDLAALIREHGPGIFRPKWKSAAGFASARYDSAALRSAIEKILGRTVARQPFADLPVPLLIVAVDDQTSEPRLFRTRACNSSTPDSLPVMDVALATSAAPTFFPPHQAGERTYIDGGIVANAPDMLLAIEAMRRFAANWNELHLLGIGTASNPRVGTTEGSPGKIGWVMRHRLIELIMDSQAALVADQLAALPLASNLRIESRPSRRIEMDDTGAKTAIELRNLAEQSVAEVKADQLTTWRRFAAHVARR